MQSVTQNIFQNVHHHPFLIRWNFNKATPIRFECANRSQIGRAFTKHDISFVQKDFSGQVQPLLRTMGYQNIVFIESGAQTPVHPVGNPFPQRSITFRCGILKCFCTCFFQYNLIDLIDFIYWKKFRSRQTTSKRNHIFLFSHF